MKAKVIVTLAVVAFVFLLLAPTALAAKPDGPAGPPGAFLCPVVGDGVLTAPGRADAVITPPVGTSFLPGKNQAGAHANPNAHNTSGPGNPDAGPGGNSDFSPIWPPSG
jgi:hypothetical protein